MGALSMKSDPSGWQFQRERCEREIGRLHLVGASVRVLAGPMRAAALRFPRTHEVGGFSSHVINAFLFPKLPYDPVRDLTPITVVVTQSYGAIVPNSLPVKTVKDMIALAKAKPGELNFASSGNGSASHLAAEMFKSMAGVDMTHIPYK